MNQTNLTPLNKFKVGDRIVWEEELGVIIDRSSYTHWIIETNYGSVIHVYNDELQLNKNHIVSSILRDL